MSDDMKQNVNMSSADFKEGVEAGVNSTAHTENWKAGNQLGQELKTEGKEKGQVYGSLFKESATPLFMRDSPAGNRGNDQDEKDETEE